MAILSDTDRALTHAEWMALGDFPPTVLKADLRAAVNAVDDWVDLNAADYNLALPQPFRGAATASQKALVLQFVVSRRFSTGV